MIEEPGGHVHWRVGHHADPLCFPPADLYEFSHRFDDAHRRFRTLYCAALPETCLREVLADFRPSLSAVARHIGRYGPEAAADVPAMPVTAAWRRQNVLAPIILELDGPLVDLCDASVRGTVEARHADVLAEHGLDHLDLHEITTHLRSVTQTVAAGLFDQGVAGVRFPSRLDGEPCVALFEGRGELTVAGPCEALTDPAPQALSTVAREWRLEMEPAARVLPE